MKIQAQTIDLSNAIYDALEHGKYLKYGITTGCRCMGCHTWKIYNRDDSVFWEAEELTDLLNENK